MADEKNQEKPHIFVDDDWKVEAQREKEKLAEEAKKKAEQAPAGEGEAGARDPHEIPPASMVTLINTIAMQAMMAMGGMEDPETGKRYVDLAAAKFHIDTLGVLEEKTKGNLAEEEADLMTRALAELRMAYVQIANHIAAQVKKNAGKGQV